ncbi:MAG: SDR family NAD(P)-dependent oxidoreductase [Myxococcota bacterium]|nr:SDR family NAD(P)-dependent oxidoreductase [Myxococcota bacterium]
MQRTLIVGASRGIGLSLSQVYKALGHQVIGTTRTPNEALEATVDEAWTGVDVTAESLEDKLTTALQQRTLNRLIIVAGILESDDLSSLAPDSLKRQFEVNAVGALRSAAALRGFMAPDSVIAFITSRMGSIADNTSGGYYGYRMSKAALNAGAKSLAIDLAPSQVNVAILHPGFVRTDMTNGQGFIDPRTSAEMLKDQIESWKTENTGIFKHASGEILPW